MSAGCRFRWNSWPFVVFRVVAYLAILGMLWHWKTSSGESRPAASERSDLPEGAETTVETTLYFPKVTLYGWSVRSTAEGGQQVDVLLRFDANSDEVELAELKLRAKGSDANLASAQCDPGETKVSRGLGIFRFLLPAGQPEFRAGSVFCWVKDLCILDRNQRITPQQLDRWVEELKSGSTPERGDAPVMPPTEVPGVKV